MHTVGLLDAPGVASAHPGRWAEPYISPTDEAQSRRGAACAPRHTTLKSLAAGATGVQQLRHVPGRSWTVPVLRGGTTSDSWASVVASLAVLGLAQLVVACLTACCGSCTERAGRPRLPCTWSISREGSATHREGGSRKHFETPPPKAPRRQISGTAAQDPQHH